MTDSSFTPKPYAVERSDYPLKQWRFVDCFETEAEAVQKFYTLGLHQGDKARVRDCNTGVTIASRSGTVATGYD